VLHRGGGAVTYPARFQLVLAANPCPCGRPAHDCTCAPPVRRRYQQRLSGPLLDRIDLRVEVQPVAHADLLDRVADRTADRESSDIVAARVAQARMASAQRWGPLGWQLNGDVPGAVLRSPRWSVARAVLAPVEDSLSRGELSARGFDRVLRLAWTVADLSGRTSPGISDVAEALYFRTGRAGEWAA
jgi:magnesium chelatase family protein